MVMGDREQKIGMAVVIVLVIGLLFEIGAGVYFFASKHTTSWGEEVANNENYVIIEDQTLTQEDLDQIASLKNLSYLELTNCDVSECRLPELTFASDELYSVAFKNMKLWDTSFLANLQASELDLTDCEGIDTLEGLNWEALTELHVDGTDVKSLKPVQNSHLRRLSFARTEVDDLRPLAELDGLWEVDGSYTQIDSLDLLSTLDDLFEISFDGCSLEQVSKPFASKYLTRVSLANTGVRDVSGLSACEGMGKIVLGGNPELTDMSWLGKDSYETLAELNLAQTGVSADDLAWLSSCTELRKLTLDGIELDNVDFCKKMHQLETLSVVGCGITDVAGIKGLGTISALFLGYNRIDGLEDIPLPQEEWERLDLDLSYNNLKSLKGLKAGHYRTILIQGNDPEIGRTIPKGVECYQIALPWFSGIEDGYFSDYNTAGKIYLLDCPEDKVDRMERYFSSYRLKLLDEDELLELLETDGLDYSTYESFAWYASYARNVG